MKKINYLDFMGGHLATIRSIEKQQNSSEKGIIHLEVSLEESDEIIKLFVEADNVFKIKEGTVIKYSISDSPTGCCYWKNGIGPFEINY